MKGFNKISKLILAVMLFACVEEVTPPSIDNIEDKLVVNSVISPYLENISVEVSLSEKAFGIIDSFGSDIISNATVVLSNGTSEVTLPFDFTTDQYVIPTTTFPIEEGVTYRLEVSAGGRSVSAEATLPQKIGELESLDFSAGTEILNVSWIDIPGEENFYRVAGFGNLEDDFGGYQNSFFFDSDEFVSDINRDGERISARGEGFLFGGSYESIEVKIISCDEMYFDYFEILSIFIEDDPFADPVRLPSNIEGGLGLFSAVQVSEFTVEL